MRSRAPDQFPPEPTPGAVVVAITAMLALVASGCGVLDSLDDGSEAAGSTTVPATATTVAVTASTTVDIESDEEDDDEDVETIADLEAGWAVNRAAMIDRFAASGYGVDEEGLLTGPGQFSVDLTDCPSEWDEIAGVSDDRIRIAMVTAQSGPFRAFNEVALGMQAYFNYVNNNGGIDGRAIELIVADDGYDATLTSEVVDGVLEAENPFYVSTVGSPGSLAVYDDLNEACVPHPFVVSAHPAWADPAGHPFTTGFQMSYVTEAILWGNWIKENLADRVPVSVGALVIDNEFGRLYADAFERWAAINSDIVSEVITAAHDPAGTTVQEEIAELAEARPTIFLSITAGDACLSAIREAARSGLSTAAEASFTTSGCQEPATYFAPVGDAGHGFWVVDGGVKSASDPAFETDTYVRFVNDELTAIGLDPSRVLVAAGFAQYGWAHVEMLRLASALPGGLTRSNLLLALRGSELPHPMLFDGVRFAVDGSLDASFVEGGLYSRYDADSQAWFQQSSVIDLNGTSPNCDWVRLSCRN